MSVDVYCMYIFLYIHIVYMSVIRVNGGAVTRMKTAWQGYTVTQCIGLH